MNNSTTTTTAAATTLLLLLPPQSPDVDAEHSVMSFPCVLVSYILLTPMIVMAVVGNLLLVVSYVRDPVVRAASSNLYLLHLALADLLVGVFCIPVTLFHAWHLYIWQLEAAFCKVYVAACHTLFTEAILLIVLLACSKLASLRTSTPEAASLCVNVKAGLTWLYSLLVGVGPIIAWQASLGPGSPTFRPCPPGHAQDSLTYNLLSGLFTIFGPLLALLLVTHLVFHEVRRRNQVMERSKAARKVGFSRAAGHVTLRPTKSALACTGVFPAENRAHAELKEVKRMLVYLVVFTLCWLPFSLLQFRLRFCPDQCVSFVLFQFFHWLFLFRSAISPWLYARSDPSIRFNVIYLLSYVCLCGRNEAIREQQRRVRWKFLAREVIRSLRLRKTTSMI